MRRILLLFILQIIAAKYAASQSFTVAGLLELSSLPSKNIDPFMKKNGFAVYNKSGFSKFSSISYIEKIKDKNKDTLNFRSVELYNESNSRYFSLYTYSLNEYMDGQKQLIADGFLYDKDKELDKTDSMLYQKKNITVIAKIGVEDNIPQYSFLVQKKELPNPATIRNTEDLLNFNSHEYLAGFFGEKNVLKDYYYFSEKELKNCSVLFSNTNRQVLFVWDDNINLRDLSYIVVGNIIPTLGSKNFDKMINNNFWVMKNGIYSGMSIRELLKLNENDFEIYGNKSNKELMIKPGSAEKIDLKKIAIQLNCINCNDDRFLNKETVSALAIAEKNLPMIVQQIVLYNTNR